MSANSTEIDLIADLLKEVRENQKEFKAYASESIKDSYGLVGSTLEDILQFSKNWIEEMKGGDKEKIETAREFLYDHLDQNHKQFGSVRKLSDGGIEFGRNVKPDWYEDDEKLYEVMSSVKDLSLDLLKFDIQLKELRDDSQKILNQYYDFMNSDEVKNARKERLEIMKKSIENETDPVKKAKLLKSISAIEASINMTFIFERIERLGEKELKSIMDTFFDGRRGEIIMEKYKSKVGKYKIDPYAYQHFFYIEEKYLPKEYHTFNNLFLFFFMRLVAYSDPYRDDDKLFVMSLAGNISSLIYNRFETEELKNNFIAVIMRFDSYFESWRDRFVKYNTTAPENPVRIENDRKKDGVRREKVLDKFKKLNITDYDPEASTDELYEFLSKRVDEMIEEQTKDEKETSSDEINVETDGETVKIEPKFETNESETEDNTEEPEDNEE